MISEKTPLRHYTVFELIDLYRKDWRTFLALEEAHTRLCHIHKCPAIHDVYMSVFRRMFDETLDEIAMEIASLSGCGIHIELSGKDSNARLEHFLLGPDHEFLQLVFRAQHEPFTTENPFRRGIWYRSGERADRAHDIKRHLKKVAGFFDARDFLGAWEAFKLSDSYRTNLISIREQVALELTTAGFPAKRPSKNNKL